MATLEEQKKLLVPFLQVWPPPPLLPGSGCCCSHRRCRVYRCPVAAHPFLQHLLSKSA